MRLYLPATLRQISGADGLQPAKAYAVTPELAAALPEEDEEGLEFAALLAAADDAVALLTAEEDTPRRRVVVVAEVPDNPRSHLSDALPSAVVPPDFVPWSAVVSLHVDEEDAEPDVAEAARGDDEAFERTAERDLLWFDVSELDVVRRLGWRPRPSGDDGEGR